MAEGVFEQSVKIVGVFFEVFWRECEEWFENVESGQVWRNVGILEKCVNVFFKIGPTCLIGWYDATSNLSQSVSDMFLHA